MSTWLEASQSKTLENLQVYDVFRQRLPPVVRPNADPSPAEIYPYYNMQLVSESFLVAQPFEKLFAGLFMLNDRNVSDSRP